MGTGILAPALALPQVPGIGASLHPVGEARCYFTDRLARQVERIVATVPEVASYARRTGVQLGGGLTEADEGDYSIRPQGGSRRPIEAVVADVRGPFAARVPGLEIETAQPMEELIGDLTAVPQPVEVKPFGDDPAGLASAASRVGKAIGAIDGVVEVVDGLRVAGDSLAVKIRPAPALQQWLDPDTRWRRGWMHWSVVRRRRRCGSASSGSACACACAPPPTCAPASPISNTCR